MLDEETSDNFANMTAVGEDEVTGLIPFMVNAAADHALLLEIMPVGSELLNGLHFTVWPVYIIHLHVKEGCAPYFSNSNTSHTK